MTASSETFGEDGAAPRPRPGWRASRGLIEGRRSEAAAAEGRLALGSERGVCERRWPTAGAGRAAEVHQWSSNTLCLLSVSPERWPAVGCQSDGPPSGVGLFFALILPAFVPDERGFVIFSFWENLCIVIQVHHLEAIKLVASHSVFVSCGVSWSKLSRAASGSQTALSGLALRLMGGSRQPHRRQNDATNMNQT